MGSTSETTVFVIRCKVLGKQFHLLWLSESSGSDHVFMAGSRIRCFPNEAEARRFALTNFGNVSQNLPVVYDFDAIKAWCADAGASNVDYKQALDAWNLLTDVAREPDFPNAFVDAQRRESTLYDKLFWSCNLLTAESSLRAYAAPKRPSSNPDSG